MPRTVDEFYVRDVLKAIHISTAVAREEEVFMAWLHEQTADALSVLDGSELVCRDGAWYRLVRVDAPREDTEPLSGLGGDPHTGDA